jgi:hypothetical protein
VSAAAERHIALGELDGSPRASGVLAARSHTASAAALSGSYSGDGGRASALLCRSYRIHIRERRGGLRGAHHGVAFGVPILRWAQDRYVAPDAFASMTEAMTRLLGLSKNPVLASNMKHRAIPCEMFADKPP